MWLQFTANVDESVAEQVSDAFIELGALSVSFEDAGDQPLYEPLPGETPLWELTRIVALFDEDAVNDHIYRALNSIFPGKLQNWGCVTVEDRVWERVWMEHFHPMKFGQRLWVIPTGFDYPEGDVVTVLLLAPEPIQQQPCV
jgi:ribosomal protein L11 methyltransferase